MTNTGIPAHVSNNQPLTASQYHSEAARLLRASARQDDANLAAATLRALQSIAASLLASGVPSRYDWDQAANDHYHHARNRGASRDEAWNYAETTTHNHLGPRPQPAEPATESAELAPGRLAGLAREGSS